MDKFLLKFRVNEKGFTLIELIAVLVISSIILLFAVPSVLNNIAYAKTQVCYSNQAQIERTYKERLLLEGSEHTDTLFEETLAEFYEDLCPEHGEISYVDGKVICSLHGSDDGEEVPHV